MADMVKELAGIETRVGIIEVMEREVDVRGIRQGTKEGIGIGLGIVQGGSPVCVLT